MKDMRKPMAVVVNYCLIALSVCGGHVLYKQIEAYTHSNIEMLMLFSIISGFFFGTYSVIARWQYIVESAILYRNANRQIDVMDNKVDVIGGKLDLIIDEVRK